MSMKIYSPSNLNLGEVNATQDQASSDARASAVLVLSDSEVDGASMARTVIANRAEAIRNARENPSVFSEESVASVALKADRLIHLEARPGEMDTVRQSLRNARKNSQVALVTFVNPEEDLEALYGLLDYFCSVIDTRLPAWMPVADV